MHNRESSFLREVDSLWESIVAPGHEPLPTSASLEPLLASSADVLAFRFQQVKGAQLSDFDNPHDAIMHLRAADKADKDLSAHARIEHTALYARLMAVFVLEMRCFVSLPEQTRCSSVAFLAAATLDLFLKSDADRAIDLGEVIIAHRSDLSVALGDIAANTRLGRRVTEAMLRAVDAANVCRRWHVAARFLASLDAAPQELRAHFAAELERRRALTLAGQGCATESLAAAERACELATNDDARAIARLTLLELHREILGNCHDSTPDVDRLVAGIHEVGGRVAVVLDELDRGVTVPSATFSAIASQLDQTVDAAEREGLDPAVTVLFRAKHALARGASTALLRPQLQSLAGSRGPAAVQAAILLALEESFSHPERLAEAFDRARAELDGLAPLEVNRTLALSWVQASAIARRQAWAALLRWQEHLIVAIEAHRDWGTPEHRMQEQRLLFPEFEFSCFMQLTLAEAVGPTEGPRLLMLLHNLFALFSGIGLKLERAWRCLALDSGASDIEPLLADLSAATVAGDFGRVDALSSEIRLRLFAQRKISASVFTAGPRDNFRFPQILIFRTASFIHAEEPEKRGAVFHVDNLHQGVLVAAEPRSDDGLATAIHTILDAQQCRPDVLARLSRTLVPYVAAALPACFGLRVSGLLHTVPWSALTTIDGQAIGEIAVPVLLADETDPAILSAPLGAAPRILVVADPDYGTEPLTAPMRRAAVGRTFPRLPGTRAEARSIAAVFPGSTRLLEGSKATRSSLLQALSSERPEILHLAVHAVSDGETPERSHLVLARAAGPTSPLTGLAFGEVSLMDLRGVRLVVLSACSTMHGRTHQAEGILALSWAFRAAGAAAVACTRWPVDDDAAAEFWRIFYRELTPDSSIPAAFLAATRHLRQDPRFAEPYDWAAYQLVA